MGKIMQLLLTTLSVNIVNKMQQLEKIIRGLSPAGLQEYLPRFVKVATFFGKVYALCVALHNYDPPFSEKVLITTQRVTLFKTDMTYTIFYWAVAMSKKEWEQLKKNGKVVSL